MANVVSVSSMWIGSLSPSRASLAASRSAGAGRPGSPGFVVEQDRWPEGEHAVVGVPVVGKEILSQRTADYQDWVEAFARNHRLPIEWAEKGVRKEDHVLPWQRRMARDDAYGVYFIFKSMEQGPSFRISVPKYATKDPNYRILARQRSRFTHYYFYLRDETLGPMVMRVASFFPFQTTYYLNGHSFISQELNRAKVTAARPEPCAEIFPFLPSPQRPIKCPDTARRGEQNE